MGNCCNILFHFQLRKQLYARVPRTVLEARGRNHLQLHQMLQPPQPPSPTVSNTFYHIDSDSGWTYLLLSKNDSLNTFCPYDVLCTHEIKENVHLCLILDCIHIIIMQALNCISCHILSLNKKDKPAYQLNI